MGARYALDFGAVLALADAMGATSALLVDVLPHVEPVIVKAYQEQSENAD